MVSINISAIDRSGPPQLLICDRHSSHNNIEFIELARKENIVIIELPSHTSHWTQPLDRSFFNSLKNRWNTEVANFTQITGVPVGHGQFFRMFSKAWESASEPSVITNGFKATCIFPFNPEAIPDEAYKPSMLYEQPQPQEPQHVPTDAPASEDVGLNVLNLSGTSDTLQTVDIDNMNSVSLSVPLADPMAVMLTDLPIFFDAKGNMTSSNMDTEVEMTTLTDEKALEVVESTMNSTQLLRFTAGYLSKQDIDDPMFTTWKLYKDKLSAISQTETNQLKLPQVPTSISQKRFSANNKPETQYFVITADEAYQHKKMAHEKKVNDQIQKEERKVERERKRKLKQETAMKGKVNVVKGKGRQKKMLT